MENPTVSHKVRELEPAYAQLSGFVDSGNVSESEGMSAFRTVRARSTVLQHLLKRASSDSDLITLLTNSIGLPLTVTLAPAQPADTHVLCVHGPRRDVELACAEIQRRLVSLSQGLVAAR